MTTRVVSDAVGVGLDVSAVAEAAVVDAVGLGLEVAAGAGAAVVDGDPHDADKRDKPVSATRIFTAGSFVCW